MRWRTPTVWAAAALLLLAAACGGDGDGGEATSGTGEGATSATGDQRGAGSLYGGGTGKRSTGSETGSGAADADLTVTLNNYLFDPSDVEVAVGAVVEVRNANTRAPHTFTVAGEDVDLELGPQETGTITIDLAPGTYDLFCRFHEQLGMTGSLTVT